MEAAAAEAAAPEALGAGAAASTSGAEDSDSDSAAVSRKRKKEKKEKKKRKKEKKEKKSKKRKKKRRKEKKRKRSSSSDSSSSSGEGGDKRPVQLSEFMAGSKRTKDDGVRYSSVSGLKISDSRDLSEYDVRQAEKRERKLRKLNGADQDEFTHWGDDHKKKGKLTDPAALALQAAFTGFNKREPCPSHCRAHLDSACPWRSGQAGRSHRYDAGQAAGQGCQAEDNRQPQRLRAERGRGERGSKGAFRRSGSRRRHGEMTCQPQRQICHPLRLGRHPLATPRLPRAFLKAAHPCRQYETLAKMFAEGWQREGGGAPI